eukprot:scaffold3092_cov121-Isochrysis_galbana.AAC.7
MAATDAKYVPPKKQSAQPNTMAIAFVGRHGDNNAHDPHRGVEARPRGHHILSRLWIDLPGTLGSRLHKAQHPAGLGSTSPVESMTDGGTRLLQQ